ncbi:MAG: triose-phosphate isomerase [Patescibacteria group bacterium]|nr:triose-phosphate isomerase [Patescibacteria group bacterium]
MTTQNKIMIAGNWKMNLTVNQASLLVQRLHERIQLHRDIEIVLAPTMLHLQPLSLQIDHRKFSLASQDAYHKDEGAYTGQVSFTMIRHLVKYGIIGHSERRHIFNESLDEVTKKVSAAYRNDITPILCVGETTIDKLSGETNQVLHDQIVTAVSGLTSEEIESLVVAYEPVWAIGSGDYAKPHEVSSAIKTIRNNISELYGVKAANLVRVLYGGSVTPDIASGYLRLPGINGLLVGGASLNYHSFSEIVHNAYLVSRNILTKTDRL